MYNIIITALLIGAFFMCTGSYWIGVKHGKLLSNGIIPKINLNPFKTIIQAVEDKKNTDKVTEELTDIMGATRESMLKAIKNEVK